MSNRELLFASTSPDNDFNGNYEGVSLLLHGNGFWDDSLNDNQLTNTGVVSSTTQSKFGGSSLYFSSTSNRLTIPHSTSLDLSGGDFTLEAWIRPTGTYTNFNGIFSKRQTSPTASRSWQLYLNQSTGAIVWANSSGSSTTSTTTPTANIWSHIACVMQGTTVKVYLNGVVVLTATSQPNVDHGEPVYIGNSYNTTQGFLGYMDEVRITKGEARYFKPFTPYDFEFYSRVDVPNAPVVSIVNKVGGNAVTVTITPTNPNGSPISSYTITGSDAQVVTTTALTYDLVVTAGAYSVTVIATNAIGDSAVSNTASTNVPDSASTTLLLLNGNGVNNGTSLIDNSKYNRSLTKTGAGSIVTSTAQFKFGTASLLFTPTAYIATTSADFALGGATKPFTIEMWVNKTTALTSSTYLISFGSNSTGLYIQSTAKFNIISNGTVIISSTTLATLNTWFHVAWCWDGTTHRLFINGIQQGTSTSSFVFSSTMYIGVLNIGAVQYPITAYIDDLRIHPSAIYTSNFAVPTAELLPL